MILLLAVGVAIVTVVVVYGFLGLLNDMRER